MFLFDYAQSIIKRVVYYFNLIFVNAADAAQKRFFFS